MTSTEFSLPINPALGLTNLPTKIEEDLILLITIGLINPWLLRFSYSVNAYSIPLVFGNPSLVINRYENNYMHL